MQFGLSPTLVLTWHAGRSLGVLFWADRPINERPAGKVVHVNRNPWPRPASPVIRSKDPSQEAEDEESFLAFAGPVPDLCSRVHRSRAVASVEAALRHASSSRSWGWQGGWSPPVEVALLASFNAHVDRNHLVAM